MCLNIYKSPNAQALADAEFDGTLSAAVRAALVAAQPPGSTPAEVVADGGERRPPVDRAALDRFDTVASHIPTLLAILRATRERGEGERVTNASIRRQLEAWRGERRRNAAVDYSIKTLEAAGLVAVDRPDGPRGNNITLTDTGETFVAQFCLDDVLPRVTAGDDD